MCEQHRLCVFDYFFDDVVAAWFTLCYGKLFCFLRLVLALRRCIVTSSMSTLVLRRLILRVCVARRVASSTLIIATLYVRVR